MKTLAVSLYLLCACLFGRIFWLQVQSCSVRSPPEEETVYGFVKFVNVAAARRAIRALNGKDSHDIICQERVGSMLEVTSGGST